MGHSSTTASTSDNRCWKNSLKKSGGLRRRGRRRAMAEFLLAAAVFLLATVALGLARIGRRPPHAHRMMPARLLAPGGVAALVLAGKAVGTPASVDLALILALLAAF